MHTDNNNNNNNNNNNSPIWAWASSFRGYLVFVHLQQWGTGWLAALFNSILMWLLETSGSQSGDLGEKRLLEFSLRTLLVLLHARKVLLHAVNLRHGTDGFTSPPKEVVLRIFITLKKIHRPRSGSNPRTLGPMASTLTTSPTRSTTCTQMHFNNILSITIYGFASNRTRDHNFIKTKGKRLF
jgi:hypothetical protein